MWLTNINKLKIIVKCYQNINVRFCSGSIKIIIIIIIIIVLDLYCLFAVEN